MFFLWDLSLRNLRCSKPGYKTRQGKLGIQTLFSIVLKILLGLKVLWGPCISINIEFPCRDTGAYECVHYCIFMQAPDLYLRPRHGSFPRRTADQNELLSRGFITQNCVKLCKNFNLIKICLNRFYMIRLIIHQPFSHTNWAWTGFLRFGWDTFCII